MLCSLVVIVVRLAARETRHQDKKPAAQGNVFLTLLRHDSAALARYARAGLTAKVVPSAPEVAYLWLDRSCGGSWLTHCPL
jgi:hypothetical protein